jgi:hypothetical protein
MAKLTPLNLTSVFAYAEEASGQSLTNAVMAYSLGKNGTITLEYDMVADAMMDVTNRTSPFPSKYVIDRLVKNGLLQLVYNDQQRLTTAIPFFRKVVEGKSIMVVNVTNFAKLGQDNVLRISPNILYAYLLSAAFSTIIDETIITFARDIAPIYARLFSNVVSNLGFMDNIKKEKFNFLVTNFFYYSIYGDTQTFHNPMYDQVRYNSKEVIKALDSKIPMYTDDSGYKNLKIFIDNLSRVFPEMKKLNYKNFIDRWTTSYGSSTLFAAEYIPYFFYMIISAAVMAPTVNLNKISIEVGDQLTSIYRKIEQKVSDKYSTIR